MATNLNIIKEIKINNTFFAKVVLITGASSGIGEACAKMFAAAGANLILCGRRYERLKKLALSLKKKFSIQVYFKSLDLTQKKEIEIFCQEILSHYQHIDILINNAGLALGLDKFQESDLSDVTTMIDTNITSLLHLTHFILPNMIKNNQGHIINLGSIAGMGVYSKGIVYCATKHAIRAFSQGLRMDLCGTKIKLTLIEPGMVKTEFSLVRYKGNKEFAEKTYKGLQPLTPEDVANTICYCASLPPHVNIDEIVLMPLDQASLTMSNRD